MYKNHNNHSVEPDTPCIVPSETVLRRDYSLWEAIQSEIVNLDGFGYWLTTVENAISRGYDCQAYCHRYGRLNSYIRIRDNNNRSE